MKQHIITIDEEQLREVAAALSVQIRRIERRMRWAARKTLTGGGRINKDGEPIDVEKELSIYSKRGERVERLRALLKRIDEITRYYATQED